MFSSRLECTFQRSVLYNIGDEWIINFPNLTFPRLRIFMLNHCMYYCVFQNVLNHEVFNMWEFFEHKTVSLPLSPSLEVCGLDTQVILHQQHILLG